MQILVDADACPVKQIIVQLAKQRGIPVTMLIDTSHELNDGYSTIMKARTFKRSSSVARYANVIVNIRDSHWNTVAIGGDVPEYALKRQLGRSYNLIRPKLRRVRGGAKP